MQKAAFVTSAYFRLDHHIHNMLTEYDTYKHMTHMAALVTRRWIV